MISLLRCRLLLGIILLSLMISGCASFVDSKPAEDNNTGIEYALCLPVIVAEPQPDGRVKFETTCLPDPERRYVISGSTFLGGLTLNVKRKKDMTLEEVTIDPNNAAVLAETIKAASEIKKTEIETKAAAEKEKAEAEKAALDEAKDSLENAKSVLKEATTALAQAETDLNHAQDKLQTLLNLYGVGDREPDTVIGDSGIDIEHRQAVRDAYHLVKEKEAALSASKVALEEAKEVFKNAELKHTQLASSGNVFDTTSGNTPLKGIKPPKQVWGPLIYRLEQVLDNNGELQDVRLVAMFDQPHLKTIE